MNKLRSGAALLFVSLAMEGLARAEPASSAPPKLFIQQSVVETVRIVWTNTAPNFILEQTQSLPGGTNWKPIAQTPIVQNNQFVVTLSADGGSGFFRLREAAELSRLRETSPADGEQGVAVTRETVLRFTIPLAPETLLKSENLYATFGARRLLSRAELSTDGTTATLFYLEPVPGSTRVTVIFDGSGLKDAMGRPLDPDGDGLAGGAATLSFDTYSTTPVAGSAVFGRVFASDLMPGPDTGTNAVNRPLQGVTITVDGMEETLRTTTDANGNFRLEPSPAGRFFVHIDGRTAVGGAWPKGAYYPFVGKAWEGVPGRATPAAGTGEIFLPLIKPGTLQPVSATQDTTILFPQEVIAANPALAGVSIMVPANSLFADNGTRGGRVGIAPVPPDRLPEKLPPGLDFALVITVQTDGPSNFDRPVPVRFPNLPDPVTGVKLPPGAKSGLWSFNHDTGRWELVGPMTVSGDGNFVDSDPGVGIRQPGWHGDLPGCSGDGGKLLKKPQDCPNPTNCRPKPGRDPNQFFNGCGPDGADYAIPDNPMAILYPVTGNNSNCGGFPSFYDACKQHDINYGTCGFGQANADDQFKKDLEAACQCYFPGDVQNLGRCLDLAGLYYFTVAAAPGSAAYDPAQKEACDCDCPSAGGGPSLLAAGNGASHAAGGTKPQGTLLAADAPLETGLYYYSIVDATTRQVVRRGTTATDGVAFPNDIILAPERRYSLAVVRAGTFEEGLVGFSTPQSGQRFEIPDIAIRPAFSLDYDQDGLSNLGEFVVGTDLLKPDTDGDGVLDGAEVQQGLDPLDGLPAATGIIASTPTPGNRALDVVAFNDLAVVAGGTDGVSAFNIFNGMAPVLIAQVDTPGSATRVAFSGPLIAVADGAQGLAVIDASIPGTARLTRQLSLGAVAAVATVGNIAYAGLSGGEVVAVDMVSGTELARGFVLGGMYDLAVAGDYLYVYTPSRLQAVSLLDGEFRLANSVSLLAVPGFGSRRVFSGGAFAYANNGLGYLTFSLADPERPALLSDLRTPQFGWKQIVANGSGLGVAAVGSNGTDDGPHDVSLYDLSNPANQDNFLTTFVTPGVARAVSIFNGLAYVADDFAGLQVVNYREYDRLGLPPTISLRTSAGLGVAPAGGALRVSAVVTDDVQVRNVEFYVDGALAATDGNFPFEHRFVVPVATPARSNIVVRGKATDTGGNATWSDQLTLALVADARPPRATLLSPPALSLNPLDSVTTVAATFNKPLNPATVNSNTSLLFEAGPDGVVGNGDDIGVTHSVLSYRADVNSVLFAFAAPLPVGTYRGVFRSPLAALDGVALAEEFSWTFRVRTPATWIRDSDGFWDDPANWSDGAVPLAGDLVRIDRPAGDFTIIIRTGAVEVQSLQCAETLVVSNAATLTLSRPSTTHGFALENATLRGLGDLEITGPFNWVSGRMLDAGRTVVRGTGVVGPLGKSLSERILEVAGLLQVAGNLTAVNGSTINVLPGGLLDFQGDVGIGWNCCVGAVPTLNNAGTLLKSAGAGTTELSTVLLNNSGRVEVQSGTLELLGNLDSTSTGTIHSETGARFQINLVNNALRLGAGAAITGAGAFRMLTGHLHANVDISASNLQLDGGSIRGPGHVKVTGTMEWTGGTLIGPGALEIASNATLQMTGAFQKGLSAYTLNNRGTMLWLDSGSIVGVDGAIINNRAGGLFEARSDAQLSWNCCGSALPTFNNEGTFRKSAGTNATTFATVMFNNSGMLDVQSGTIDFLSSSGTNSGVFQAAAATAIQFNSSTFRYSGSATFTGSGTNGIVASTVTLDTNIVIPNLEFRAGNVNGPGTLTVTNHLVWNSGNFVGPGLVEIPAGAVLDIETAFGKGLVGRTLRNDGVVRWQHGTTLSGLNGGMFDNLPGGLVDLQGDTAFSYAVQGALPTFNNAGTLRKSAGADSAFTSVNFTNSGVIEVQIGTLNFSPDFTQTASGRLSIDVGGLSPGSQFGRVMAGGSANLAGQLSINRVNGYEPDLGDTFQILIGGSRSGSFASTSGLTIGNGKQFQVNDTNTAVQLQVIAGP